MPELNRLYNQDCLVGLAEMPDKAVDIAIVDPPYGISRLGATCGMGKLKNRLLNQSARKMRVWDKPPSEDYFRELFRVSRNQIIWGGNYFVLPPTRGFVIWDKEQPWENFSAAEYAWTSFDGPSKIFRLPATLAVPGALKIHPTQKPVALYEFCLRHFSRPGDVVLDTHAGSGACLVAAHRFGNPWLGFEIDPDYYRKSKEWIDREMAQARLFDGSGE
jgi:site-specific DNA-methyltransferase (adenine-specific)